MTPKYILAFVTIIFVAVFSYGYISTRQPAAQTANAQTTNDQVSVQTTINQTPSDNDDTSVQPTDSTGSTDTPQATDPQPSTYTMAQVATHKSTSSCWVAISGTVYDVTQWINNHPGGPGPVLSLCGTDGTAAFGAQHGSQGRPVTELAKFQIGTLVQ